MIFTKEQVVAMVNERLMLTASDAFGVGDARLLAYRDGIDSAVVIG